MRAEQLELDFGVTPEMACVMCHLSSECGGCCVRCRAEGRNVTCGGQSCSREDIEHQTSRWETWMYLVGNNLPELAKFVPEKFRKAYNIKMKRL